MRENNIFFDATIQGIYAWIGVEFMAQTIAIFAGVTRQHIKPEIGLLLSVRKFLSYRTIYKLGESLVINIHKEYLETNLGIFNCNIHVDDVKIATAKLNT